MAWGDDEEPEKVEVRQTAGEVAPGLMESLWRYRWTIAVVTLTAAAAAAGLSLLQPVRYEATARIFLADADSTAVFEDVGPTNTDPARYVQNQAELVTTRPVAQRTSELLGGRLSPRDVLRSVEATSSADFDMVTVLAADDTSRGAAELANAVGQAYQDVIAEQVQVTAETVIERLRENAAKLEERIARAEAELDAGGNTALVAERDAAVAELLRVEQRANQLAVDASLFGSGVRLFEEADAPPGRAQPQPLRGGLLGAFLGLAAAAAFAYWRAGHSQRADDRHDPARILGVPLLGEIPDLEAVGVPGAVPARDAPQSLAAEAYQFVVASLEYSREATNARSVLLTSPHAGDGKTTTALNLALAAQRDGRSVVLVDADERVRGLSRMTGLDSDAGLTDLGNIAVPSNWCISRWKPAEGLSVSVVPAGTSPDEAVSFFRTHFFRTAMDRIRERAAMMIVDSPPLLNVSDTLAIASQVDGIVLVVRRGTPLTALVECRERLEFVGTPLLGYVFNRAAPQRSRLASYRYGYGYGKVEHNGDEAESPRRWAGSLEPSDP